MKYNRSLLTRESNKKRRLNKKRFFSVLSVLALLIAAICFLSVNGIFDNSKNKLLTLSDDTQDSTVKQNSTMDASETAGNVSEGTSAQSSTDMNPDESTGDVAENRHEDSNVEVSGPQDTSAIKSELESYIEGFEGQYGIHFLSLYDGTEFGINDTDEYVAASTVKVPINLIIFQKIKEGSINPEETLTYTKADYEGGTGSIQYKEIGTKFTVRELSKLSIEESDNVATNMLIRLIGGRKIYREFMKQSGGVVVDYNKNISCPRDMSLYLKMVYDFYIENEELGGELMGYLENTIFNDRLNKLLPPDVRVAHKIGTQARAIHDVGIIFTEKPYILSVMSKNVNEAEAPDVIANISKKVYEFATEK